MESRPFTTPGVKWKDPVDFETASGNLLKNPYPLRSLVELGEIAHFFLELPVLAVAPSRDELANALRKIVTPFKPERVSSFQDWFSSHYYATLFTGARPDCFSNRISKWSPNERELAVNYLSSHANTNNMISAVWQLRFSSTSANHRFGSVSASGHVHDVLLRFRDPPWITQPNGESPIRPFDPAKCCFEAWYVTTIRMLL